MVDFDGAADHGRDFLVVVILFAFCLFARVVCLLACLLPSFLPCFLPSFFPIFHDSFLGHYRCYHCCYLDRDSPSKSTDCFSFGTTNLSFVL